MGMKNWRVSDRSARRRAMPTMIGVGVILLGVFGTDVSRGEEGEQPNILVFVADDVDWRDFGCYGNRGIRTPAIDRLAADGVRFETAILTCPQCSPSRISVLTGRYPHSTETEDLHAPLAEGVPMVPSYLRGAGYFTGHMQKTHYGPAGNAQFDWYSKQLSQVFGEFLDEAGERPFFMWVGFRDAHRPYEEGAIDDPHDSADVTVPPYLVDDAATRRDLALYYDEISRMDGEIGSYVAELRRRGKLENTWITFFGDNGAPFPRAKGSLYDSGVGTPLVMYWPAAGKEGVVVPQLTSVIDLAPSWLEAAGVEVPESMEGASQLAGWFGDGEEEAVREYAFSERNWHDCDEHMRSVRSQDYKLIQNSYLDRVYGNPADVMRSDSAGALRAGLEAESLTAEQAQTFRVPRPEWELYDLRKDPFEFHNVADDPAYAEVRAKLAEQLADWREATGDFGPERRRRVDISDRMTGVMSRRGLPPLEE